MKSFNQFLQESYLSEGVSPSERQRSPKEQAEWDKINKREAEAAERKAQRGPTGAAARPDLQFRPQGTTTKVESPSRKPSGAATDPWRQFPRKPQQQRGMPTTGPSSTLPGRTLEPAGGTDARPALPAEGQTQRGGALAKIPKSSSALAKTPPIEAVKVSDVTKPKGKLPSGTTGGELAAKPSSVPTKNPPIEAVKVSDVTKPKGKLPSSSSSARQAIQTTKTGTDLAKGAADTLKKGGKFSKWGGRALGALGAGLDAADEYKGQRERGRSKGSSAAMGVTKAAGGLAGAQAGAAGGAALGATIGSVVPGAGTAIGGAVGGIAGGIGGYLGGSHLAGKASETIAGATGKEKAAMATARRKSQAGGAIKGIGGKTTFDTKRNTITTGTGAQKRTAQLGKTSVITGPGGKQEVGNLAYKGGQAVYKRAADPSTLAQTSSNWRERIGRSLFKGAYKKSDAANAANKLATARQYDANRQKALGVKFGPGK